MGKNDYSIIKAANRKLILNTISEYGAISITDMIHKLQLSRPTVESTVRQLLEDGIIEKAGLNKVGVGRSAQLYEIGQQRYFSIGLDLEFPAIRIAVINLKLQNIYSDSWVCSLEDDTEHILERLIARIRLAIETALGSRQKERRLLGIGIGICGQIDMNSKISLFVERVSNWRNVPLVNILKREFNVPVSMRNDVHMLSLVKRGQRNRDGILNCIYICLRSGIGMALFLQGDLFSGMMGNAGYLGHTSVDIFGPQCHCGNHGCLENYLSPKQLTHEYAQITNKTVTYPQMLELLEKNDATATQIMIRAYEIFGKAVANVVKITDIHNIIVNGLPDQGGGILLQAFRTGIAQATIDPIMKNICIYQEELMENDAAKGSAQMMIHKFFAEPQLQLMPDMKKPARRGDEPVTYP